jgi:predicted  nucleic acid-binding Zn-ribbon protein
VSEEIDHLWSLRGLDDEVATLKSALARFPQQRTDLDRRVTIERAKLEELKGRVSEIQKRRRDRERDIEAASEQERKFQSQLPAVKKNEEYTALLHEISGAKSKRSELETEVLVMLDDEDRQQRERPMLEQALAAAERESAERRAQIDREEVADREQLARLEQQRAVHVAALAPPTRQRYERIHASREGRAVVPIMKGACGGCFRAQPPQMLQEARRRDRLLSCDGCGRLLIWSPEST